ncbi:alpha/beta-hydrolase [Pleomassaria siparia CBS 279.74]|uniref:Alpha/beta-hydrolase n=1 Tax=Pleomassaria siparia CBS 279.74 TaxID=1314801 RepID=A0A6G1JS99_9PLEO|nr:alpha/beta-hydrolase [Pleomassaria siparia CBS 279.74]
MSDLRKDVEFSTFDGLRLRGWLYNAGANRPCIIMSHGFGALKEHFLPDFASRFQQAGYAVLIYDNRNWGASPGKTPNETDPHQQVRDYLDAFDYAASLPDVDSSKIVYWGTSMSGGTALAAASIDHRICAVIVQGFFVSGAKVAEKWPTEMLPMLLANRAAIKEGKGGIMVPLAPENEEELRSGQSKAILQDADIFGYHDELDKRGVLHEKMITLNSAFNAMTFEPGRDVSRIAPTPLLMVLPETDAVIGAENQMDTFQRAAEPKKLHVIKDSGHFGIYYGQQFEENIAVQLDFLKGILK